MTPRSMMPDSSTVRRQLLRLTFTQRMLVLACLLVCLLTAWLTTPDVSAAGGSLDATFQNPTVTGDSDASSLVRAITVQTDGKVMIGGSFKSVGGQIREGVARLNSDGTLDVTFQNPAVFEGVNNFGDVFAIAVQPDGKVLIGGDFWMVNGQARQNVARLNSDGTLDTTFQNPEVVNREFFGSVFALTVQNDGKVVIGGRFTSVRGQARQSVARLNPDGTLDTTFLNPAPVISYAGSVFPGVVYALTVQTDGRAVIGGVFNLVGGREQENLARLNPDGTPDTTFQNPAVGDGIVFAFAMQTDGKFVIAGDFTLVGGQERQKVARLNADGTFDTTFQNPEVLFPRDFGGVVDLAVQTDGKVVIGGDFASVGGQARKNIARLNPDGTLDTAFPNLAVSGMSPYFGDLSALTLQNDGKVVIGGGFTSVDGQTRQNVARLNTKNTKGRRGLRGRGRTTSTQG